MKIRMAVGLLLALGILFTLACSDDNTSGSDGSDGDGDSDSDSLDGTGDSDADGDSDSDGDADGDADSDPEVCDGVDNDGNGIVDDVDEGADGICDCLNIGTIGAIGPWSTGGDIFKTWLDTRSPIGAFEIGDQELTPERLDGLQIIVVLRVDTAPLDADSTPAHHAFSESEVAALEDWVRNGGGLMTTIGYQGDEAAEVENVNRLLEPFGVQYQNESQYLDLGGFVTQWEDHPIANGVTSVNTDNGVEPDPAGGTLVARDGNDNTAMVVAEPGEGSVIVFGDEWITYDSEWEDLAEQQVELLWLNMFKWMSPAEVCQVEIPPILIE